MKRTPKLILHQSLTTSVKLGQDLSLKFDIEDLVRPLEDSATKRMDCELFDMADKRFGDGTGRIE